MEIQFQQNAKNSANTSIDMYHNIQDCTLFALGVLRLKSEDKDVQRLLEAYGITEKMIAEIREFYTSSEYHVF